MGLIIHLLLVILIVSLIFQALPIRGVNFGDPTVRTILIIVLLIVALNALSGAFYYPEPRPYFWGW